MNRDESIALWLKGKDAWNEWANGMLAERKALEDAGEWEVEKKSRGRLDGKNQATKSWIKIAHVDLSSIWIKLNNTSNTPPSSYKHNKILSINGNANFSKFIFPSNLSMGFTIFDCNDVLFDGCIFHGDAYFGSTLFNDFTSFFFTRFEGHANFASSTFKSVVMFDNSIFERQSIFNLAHFEKPVSFKQAIFKSTANFASITSDKSFNLLGTKFAQAPDFTEAAFHAPPVLDELKISEPLKFRMWNWRDDLKEPRANGMSIVQIANCPTDTRKYRALAKMAAEAKDYQNEMRFFTDEQRCRRFWHDKPFGRGMGRFWFGLLYEKTSNFGRSFWRPLWGWLVSTIIFAVFYGLTSAHKLESYFDPIYISIRHGLIFSGLTRSERWDSSIRALYEVKKDSATTIEIPNTAALLMLSQPLISAVFIFLFLLAVRNQFKIR